MAIFIIQATHTAIIPITTAMPIIIIAATKTSRHPLPQSTHTNPQKIIAIKMTLTTIPTHTPIPQTTTIITIITMTPQIIMTTNP